MSCIGNCECGDVKAGRAYVISAYRSCRQLTQLLWLRFQIVLILGELGKINLDKNTHAFTHQRAESSAISFLMITSNLEYSQVKSNEPFSELFEKYNYHRANNHDSRTDDFFLNVFFLKNFIAQKYTDNNGELEE